MRPPTTAPSRRGRRRTASAATGDCYQVTVSNPATRPATHWDATLQENLSAATPKTWTLHVGHSFTDVPTSAALLQEDRDGAARGNHDRLHGNGVLPREHGHARPDGALRRPRHSGQRGGDSRRRARSTPAPTVAAPAASRFSPTCPPTDICVPRASTTSRRRTSRSAAGGADDLLPDGPVTRQEMSAFVAKAVVAPQGGAGVPLTYGPDPVTGFSYSCDQSEARRSTSRTCRRRTPSASTRTTCGRADSSTAAARRPTARTTSVTRDAMAKFLSNAFNYRSSTDPRPVVRRSDA